MAMAAAGLRTYSELSADGRLIASAIGDIDACTASQFDAFLADLPVPPDVIDCRFVTFLGAAGARSLVAARDIHDFSLIGSIAVTRTVQVCDLTDRLCPSDPIGGPAFHYAPFGVAVHDADLRFEYVNDAMAETNGLPSQAHVGHRPEQVFGDGANDLVAVHRRVLVSGESETVHVTGATPGNRTGSWQLDCHRVRCVLDGEHRRQIVALVTANDRSAAPAPGVKLDLVTERDRLDRR